MIIKNDNTKHITANDNYLQFLAQLGKETDCKDYVEI